MKRTTLLLTLAPLGLACGEDAADPVGGMPAESPETPSLITTTDSGSQKESNIDSTDGEAWVFISFRAGGVQVEVSDPMADAGWDVGFRRSNVRVNGGASGSGNGAVALIAGTTFDEVSRAPAMGWLTDEAEIEMGPDGSPVMNDGVDFAFTRAQGDDAPNGWFSYNPATHVLTPQDVVWAIRTPEDGYFALKIVDWYDAAGTSAVWTVRWKAILPPL